MAFCIFYGTNYCHLLGAFGRTLQWVGINEQNLLAMKHLAWIFVLVGIHSMQGLTATTRHGVTRTRSTKRLKHTGNLFRKKPHLLLRVCCFKMISESEKEAQKDYSIQEISLERSHIYF